MKNYRKRPVIVQAVQWTGDNLDEVEELDYSPSGRVRTYSQHGYPTQLEIATLEGHIFASIGDWIIRGAEDELYPCKPSIFESTYEDV